MDGVVRRRLQFKGSSLGREGPGRNFSDRGYLIFPLSEVWGLTRPLKILIAMIVAMVTVVMMPVMADMPVVACPVMTAMVLNPVADIAAS